MVEENAENLPLLETDAYASEEGRTYDLTLDTLSSINVEFERSENKLKLLELGGVDALLKSFETSISNGLSKEKVAEMRQKYGDNVLPESPMEGLLEIFFGAFNDTILIILLIAASVSLVIGIIEEPSVGWIEGTAILVAVLLVAIITAVNEYTSQLQFLELEKSAQRDERCSVLRDGTIERINPSEVVVGDILLLQAGDMIPADAVLVPSETVRSDGAFMKQEEGTKQTLTRDTVKSNESTLTGESNEIYKSIEGDCFLLSSCLITEACECRALVIAVGENSQWGKIKATLVIDEPDSPLQQKLQVMAEQIGYIGMIAAVGTFSALVLSIWLRDDGQNITTGILTAFILTVTILVAAIPEGLPLSVTIAMAYSTRQMYNENNFVRTLASCETMGNVTDICTDKTGTLTENILAVTEGWFANKTYSRNKYSKMKLKAKAEALIVDNSCVNRIAYLLSDEREQNNTTSTTIPVRNQFPPRIIGNKTEGALMQMARGWGHDENAVKSSHAHPLNKMYPFDSFRKKSSAIIHRTDGSVTLFCKGAGEIMLENCTRYISSEGEERELNLEKRLVRNRDLTFVKATRSILNSLNISIVYVYQSVTYTESISPPICVNLCLYVRLSLPVH